MHIHTHFCKFLACNYSLSLYGKNLTIFTSRLALVSELQTLKFEFIALQGQVAMQNKTKIPTTKTQAQTPNQKRPHKQTKKQNPHKETGNKTWTRLISSFHCYAVWVFFKNYMKHCYNIFILVASWALHKPRASGADGFTCPSGSLSLRWLYPWRQTLTIPWARLNLSARNSCKYFGIKKTLFSVVKRT